MSMRILVVAILSVLVVGCQRATLYERDVAGRTASLAELPPAVSVDQQFRMDDWGWHFGVATCVTAAHRTAPVDNERELARYCACNFDLVQTRMSLQQYVYMDRLVSPARDDAVQRRQKIADACKFGG